MKKRKTNKFLVILLIVISLVLYFSTTTAIIKNINLDKNKDISFKELKNHAVHIQVTATFDIMKFTTKMLDKSSLYNYYNIRIDDYNVLGKIKVSWGGSGVIVKKDRYDYYVLTAKHVVEVPKKFKDVITIDSIYVDDIEADIVATDPIVDLGMVKTKHLLKKPVRLAKKRPKLLSKIEIFGNPLGIKNIYTKGFIAGKWQGYYIFQATALPGNSGSGVFNDKGELVSVLTAGFAISQYQRTETLTVGINYYYIKAFLEDVLDLD